MVVTIYYLAYSLAYYLGEKLTTVFPLKETIIIGSALNLPYIAIYLIPASCTTNNKGICNHVFCGILLFLFAIIGGLGSGVTWVAKGAYLRKCSDSETEEKHNDIFGITVRTSALVAAGICFFLLTNDTVRTALYIIMTIIAVDGIIIQVCKLS